MDALERIRAVISGFGGYHEAGTRRASDEQIRAFVGEALAALPAVEIDALAAEERSCYDRVLLRCEFINQEVFQVFDGEPTAARVEATLLADVEVVEAAIGLRATQTATLNGVLTRVHDALDKRDAAMLSS